MPWREGDIVFDQDLLERLSKATGVTKGQMRHWIKDLAEGLGIELPRYAPKRYSCTDRST